MLLIFYALEPEVRAFRRRLQQLARLEVQGCKGWRASVDGTQLTLISTGVGAQRAAASARRALKLFGAAQLVISTGFAGALTEELSTGTIVVADRLLWDAPAPGANAPIAAPAQLKRRVVRALSDAKLSVVAGPTLTAPAVLADGLSKRRAHAKWGAIAVDMESAAIAREAQANRLDFVYARSVLDEIDDRLPPARLMDGNGAVRPLTAAAFMLRHPAMLFKWTPRVVRNMALAGARLAQALETLARCRF